MGEAKLGVNCSGKFGLKDFLIMMLSGCSLEGGSITDLFLICWCDLCMLLTTLRGVTNVSIFIQFDPLCLSQQSY
jgi:hypothetical protein